MHLLVKKLGLDEAIDRSLGLLKIHLPYHDFDQAIALCRKAGFKNITLRGDTDFTQSAHLDGWDKQDVQFIFGIDATPKLNELAENLPKDAWKVLTRRVKHQVKTAPRPRPENVKQQVVEEREYQDIRTAKEHVAEFTYQPGKCQKAYRVVVVWKELEVYEGQKKLFDKSRYFFYITNVEEKPAEEIVFAANDRCNQENLHSQLQFRRRVARENRSRRTGAGRGQ